MTDEQFNILARYEDNLRTATNSRWARHPGRSALALINETYSAAAGIQPRRVNVLCQQCVLDLLRNAGKLYFAEKTRREEEAAKKAAANAKRAATRAAKKAANNPAPETEQAPEIKK